MPTIKRDIFIEAVPEAVTAVTENAQRFPEWFTGLERMEVVGDWPAVGSVGHFDMKAPGMAFRLSFTCLEYVEHEKLVVDMDGLMKGTTTWQYEAVDGGTAVSYILDYTLADSAEGQEMGQLISQQANEISIGQSLEKLKALVEG